MYYMSYDFLEEFFGKGLFDFCQVFSRIQEVGFTKKNMRGLSI